MIIFHTVLEIQNYVESAKQNKQIVGFVPTMGCLHNGHLSLVKASQAQCDLTVVSIFVNPTQFGPNEDFERYPRVFEQDRRLLEENKVDALFYPSVEEMYGPSEMSGPLNPPKGGLNSTIQEGIPSPPLGGFRGPAFHPSLITHYSSLTTKLCGQFRPDHFDGVITIVSKLFDAVPAHKAFFGAKDWQQQLIIRKMVAEQKREIEIVTCPIIREPDGVAMSSRNQYLSPLERRQAQLISQSLSAAHKAFNEGETDSKVVKAMIKEILISNSNNSKTPEPQSSRTPELIIQYIEICDSETLEPVAELKDGVLLAIAVLIGKTRLIDNLLLKKNV